MLILAFESYLLVVLLLEIYVSFFFFFFTRVFIPWVTFVMYLSVESQVRVRGASVHVSFMRSLTS